MKKKKKKKQRSRTDPAIKIANGLEKAGVPVSEETGLALIELGACIATLSGTPTEGLIVTLMIGVDRGNQQVADMAKQGIRLVGGHSASSKRKGQRKI